MDYPQIIKAVIAKKALGQIDGRGIDPLNTLGSS